MNLSTKSWPDLRSLMILTAIKQGQMAKTISDSNKYNKYA